MSEVMNSIVLDQKRLNHHLGMLYIHTFQELDFGTWVELNMFFTFGVVLTE